MVDFCSQIVSEKHANWSWHIFGNNRFMRRRRSRSVFEIPTGEALNNHPLHRHEQGRSHQPELSVEIGGPGNQGSEETGGENPSEHAVLVDATLGGDEALV